MIVEGHSDLKNNHFFTFYIFLEYYDLEPYLNNDVSHVNIVGMVIFGKNIILQPHAVPKIILGVNPADA